MTDALDAIVGGEDVPGAETEDESALGASLGRVCMEDGCENVLPLDSHPARRYCDDHFKGKGQRVERRRKARTGERAPKLVVDVGGARKKGGEKDQRARDTAAGAKAFLNVIATGMAASGDNVCAAAVAGGAEAWGDSVGELSKYQPWLSSFFAPVGGESQLGAWLGFMLTTGAIALPVMAHHGVLPASVGAKLGGVFVAADDVATSVPGAAAA